MNRLVQIFTIIMAAYSASAFTLQEKFPIADSSNLYVASSSCRSTASGIFFGVEGCWAGQSCIVKKGTTISVSYGFTAPVDMPAMRLVYRVTTVSSNTIYYEEDTIDSDHTSKANEPFFYAEDHLVTDHVVPAQYSLVFAILHPTDSTVIVCVYNLRFTVVES